MRGPQVSEGWSEARGLATPSLRASVWAPPHPARARATGLVVGGLVPARPGLSPGGRSGAPPQPPEPSRGP